MEVKEYRKLFPILDMKVSGRSVVYFDNAATSQRPKTVTDLQVKMALEQNANTHRAVHTLSSLATDAYEKARDAAQKFLNAESREQIIFTSGATASLNLVASSYSERFIGAGDEILVGLAEHHSNFVSWQQIAARRGAKVRYWTATENGWYDPQSLSDLLTQKTRIVCVAHASNVLGVENNIREIADICHEKGVHICVDGAQGAVHCMVDVQRMGCDFYAFSAHKLYGPTGVGVLYGKKELLEEMPPYMFGGEMVGTVSVEATTFAPLPLKFEAGTPNFNSVAALAPALELQDKTLRDKELMRNLREVSDFLDRELKMIDGLHIFGNAGNGTCYEKLPIFSFTVDGVHHEDLAILLDKMGVAVRSGQMCAEPLMTHFGVTGMLRASLMPYNTMEEAEYFVKCLKRAIEMLR